MHWRDDNEVCKTVSLPTIFQHLSRVKVKQNFYLIIYFSLRS